MKKLLVCCLCLLSNGAWAREEEEALAEEDPREQRAPALWIQPLDVALLPAGLLRVPFVDASFTQLVFVKVPLGLTVPLSPAQDLVFELTPFYQQRIYDTSLYSKALSGSVGSAWMLSGNRLGQGWFIQPKLLGTVAQAMMVDVHEGVLFDQWSAQLCLGLDVGYRVGSEQLFLEFVLGLSAGYGWNVPYSSRSVLTFVTEGPGHFDKYNFFRNKVVWDHSQNLLRLGFWF